MSNSSKNVYLCTRHSIVKSTKVYYYNNYLICVGGMCRGMGERQASAGIGGAAGVHQTGTRKTART